MSFEAKLDEHIKTLQDKQDDLEVQKNKLVHDCDCNLCDMQGEVPDEDYREFEQLTADIKDIDRQIEVVKTHVAETEKRKQHAQNIG